MYFTTLDTTIVKETMTEYYKHFTVKMPLQFVSIYKINLILIALIYIDGEDKNDHQL